MPGPQYAHKPIDEDGMPAGYPLQLGWEVTPRQVRAKLAALNTPDGMSDGGSDDGPEPPFVLLDCRTPAEVATVAIAGALVVAMQDIPSRLPELEEHADSEVVVFCHHGGRSMQVTAFLREQGFADVKSMAGGIDVWARDVDPSLMRY